MFMKQVFIIGMIVWPLLSCGQQSFFVDSLFQFDHSNLKAFEEKLYEQKISQLEKELGLSVGFTVSNSFLDEIETPISARLIIRTNLGGGGIWDSRIQSKKLRNQKKIDSIANNHHINHNYGVFYNYVIYLYNKEKANIIYQILNECISQEKVLEQLYYNKLIGYERVLDIKSIRDEFELAEASQLSYNLVFEMALDSNIQLPRKEEFDFWKLDFSGLIDAIQSDSTYMDLVLIEHDNIDLKHKRYELPQISISMGYDIARTRPHVAVNFSKKISYQDAKSKDLEKQKVSNNYKLNKIQKIKELVNYQYQYDFKIKQVYQLKHKLELLLERLRILQIKRDALSLEQSIQEQKFIIEKLLIQYEFLELQQQLCLLMLAIKKVAPHINLGDFLKPLHLGKRNKKYFASRYLLKQENQHLQQGDKYFLEQNEISLITANELIELQNVIHINPSKYKSRIEMEEAIRIMSSDKNQIIIFSSLDDLKGLELKTIRENSISHVTLNQ